MSSPKAGPSSSSDPVDEGKPISLAAPNTAHKGNNDGKNKEHQTKQIPMEFMHMKVRN